MRRVLLALLLVLPLQVPSPPGGLWIDPGMATIVVKEDGSGDFQTLAAAAAAADPGDTIQIEGSWTNPDTAPVTVSDANLTIQTTGDARHNGFVGSSPTHYRLRCATNGSHCITVNASGVTIDGLEIMQGSTGASDEGIRMAADGGTLTVKNSLIWADDRRDQQDGIYHGPIAATINVENTMIWGFGRAGLMAQHFTSATGNAVWNINSVTVADCGGGANDTTGRGGGIVAIANSSGDTITMNVFNTVVVNCHPAEAGTNADYNEYVNTGNTVWNIDYSIDTDNSIASRDAGSTGSLGSRTATDDDTPGTGDWVVFQDITNSPLDLRLKTSAENDAQDMHAAASGAGLNIPATDIAGTSRPQNTNYDAGAFEIVVAAGGDFQAAWARGSNIILGR